MIRYLLPFFIFFSISAFGQKSNDILDNPDFWGGPPAKNKNENDDWSYKPLKRAIAISDSTFLISASILMNLNADGYKLTFSLNQLAESVSLCNELIDSRINRFSSAIKSLRITHKDIYVDMVTQYPVYEYDIEKKVATQQIKGYEINKNIIVRFDSLNLLKQLVSLAAENEIYDIVKLDYILFDITKVYEELFSEAATIIERKKALYLKATNLKIQDQSMIYSEQFQFVFPGELYKSYQAFESSDVKYKGYKSNRFVEKERKKTTKYYEGINFSGFDKYINAEKIEISLQAIFQLQIKYERKKMNE